jgi:hypothetical protein
LPQLSSIKTAVPWGVDALGGTIQRACVAEQAELVSRRDRRPDDPSTGPARDVCAGGLDRCRVAGSHSIYVSQPAAVAELIEPAAEEVRSAVH